MPLISVRDGHQLHVRVLGRGKPCVLVHGFGSDSASWLPFVAPLAHRFRFYLPDLRGFGLSRRVPLRVDCPLTTYAQDLSEMAEALNLDGVPIVGISMGALSSVQCFHLGLGQRFSRYMHIDQGLVIRNGEAAHGLLGAAQPVFFEGMRKLVDTIPVANDMRYAQLSPDMQKHMAGVFAQFAQAAFTHEPVQKGVGLLTSRPNLLRYFLPEEGFATYLRIMRAYLDQDYDLREAFAAMRVPTTVLIGARSRMYPAEGQRIVQQLRPDVRVREVEGVGHMLPYEAPRVFLRELREFLEERN